VAHELAQRIHRKHEARKCPVSILAKRMELFQQGAARAIPFVKPGLRAVL